MTLRSPLRSMLSECGAVLLTVMEKVECLARKTFLVVMGVTAVVKAVVLVVKVGTRKAVSSVTALKAASLAAPLTMDATAATARVLL